MPTRRRDPFAFILALVAIAAVCLIVVTGRGALGQEIEPEPPPAVIPENLGVYPSELPCMRTQSFIVWWQQAGLTPLYNGGRVLVLGDVRHWVVFVLTIDGSLSCLMDWGEGEFETLGVQPKPGTKL